MPPLARLLCVILSIVVVLTGCSGSDGDKPHEVPREAITFESVGIDWPTVDEHLEVPDPPTVPDGFDAGRYDRMVEALQEWANATTVDPDVRGAEDPAVAVASAISERAVGSKIRKRVTDAVSPDLAAANVFSSDVEVIGDPAVTAAWQVEEGKADDGAPILSLTLQTRAAYAVRISDGPNRVVGVLRQHTLVTRAGDSGDVSIGYGWQEFGASDCALALDDALRPDSDAKVAKDDLATFVKAGSADKVSVPSLKSDEIVDEEYLKRCRAGTT